jgi:hypothetical protein
MTRMVKRIIAAASMCHFAIQPLELLNLATQLETLTTESTPSTALPPHDLASWFQAHAYLKSHVYQEMEQRSKKPTSTQHLEITLEQFKTALDATTNLQFKQLHTSASDNIDQATFIKDEQFYVQKLIIPDNSTIYFFGDLHGDISSLVICLAKLYRDGVIDEQFNITGNNYIFFGGDYIDRGWFGAEILQTVCQLKMTNPTRAFLIRGNHEKNHADNPGSFTFLYEFEQKFNIERYDLWSNFEAFYASLPAAILLGVQNKSDTNYLLLCHGGLEFYDPTELFNQKTISLDKANTTYLASKIITFDREAFITKIPEKNRIIPGSFHEENLLLAKDNIEKTIKENNMGSCGFMWNDFYAGQTGIASLQDFYSLLGKSSITNGRGFMFGSRLGNAILDTMTENIPHHHMIGVLRAHQHNKTMPQLLGTQRSDGLSNYNHSLYKIPLESGYRYHIFTKVSTSLFAPSPSFLKVALSPNPTKWLLSNFYIDNFQNHVTEKEVGNDAYRQQLYEGQHWSSKTQPLMTWQNAFDGSSKQLIEEQKKSRQRDIT